MTIGNKIAISGIVVAAAAPILAAVIGWHPWTEKSKTDSTPSGLYFAGTVVDQSTNQAIGQSEIFIVGRSDHYYSEDNGNFRIEFKQRDLSEIRVKVVKRGFKPYDNSFTLPNESAIIPLQKEK